MTEKSVEQMARDTLNALIAGRYLPDTAVQASDGKLQINSKLLKSVEAQLVAYHSMDHEKAKSDYSAGLAGGSISS